jgi:hypothetical protein
MAVLTGDQMVQQGMLKGTAQGFAGGQQIRTVGCSAAADRAVRSR